MKLLAAAIQMSTEPGRVAQNRERADEHLRAAARAGARLAVLPEMFNTGYGLLPDFAPYAEERDGPTLRQLRARSREWNLAIAAGFVERDGHHLYDSLAFCTPGGPLHVYRKQQLVFWERFRFRPGNQPLIVSTPWGRIGFAICADMIHRSIWDSYRGRIDLAIVSSAWPEFACRHTGRKHWLLGRIGPMAAQIPTQAARDLEVPVIFANQCGPTCTTIPYLGTWLAGRISDRFAGQSSVCDGRHGSPVLAGLDEETILAAITLHSRKGPHAWRFTSRSGSAVFSSKSASS